MTAYVDNHVVEGNLANATWTPGTTLVTVASGTLALTATSTTTQIFSGATAGQIVKMPDATTLAVGWHFHFNNDATVSIAIQDNAGTALLTLQPGARTIIKCTGIATAAGTWTYQVTGKDTLKLKAGVVSSGTFTGSPKKATVTFTTAFPSTSYAISIAGTDARYFTYESLLAGSFVISANANQALTGNVHWQAIATGEA
jgi:hypothetical protein